MLQRSARKPLWSITLFPYVNCQKSAQRESCELSFIWGLMRTIAWTVDSSEELSVYI